MRWKKRGMQPMFVSFCPMRTDILLVAYYTTTKKYLVCCRVGFSRSFFLPQVGMEFSGTDEAWMFWISYGGQKGFEVKKSNTNKRKSDGKVRCRFYVCANEGHRKEDKRDHLTKCPRA